MKARRDKTSALRKTPPQTKEPGEPQAEPSVLIFNHPGGGGNHATWIASFKQRTFPSIRRPFKIESSSTIFHMQPVDPHGAFKVRVKGLRGGWYAGME